MVDAALAVNVAGSYVGRSKIRPGMESALAPIERKRLAKGEDASPLDLRPDGTFFHKKTTYGRYQVVNNRILLQPKEFNGLSLTKMQEAAANAGRAFGLSWLFDPFELLIAGEKLETANSSGLVYVEYVRKS